jgi:alpha-L-rhamnosidase
MLLKRLQLAISILFVSISMSVAQGRNTELKRTYLSATRVIWQSEAGVSGTEYLLQPGIGQAILGQGKMCVLNSKEGRKPGLLLDFGRELHGGLELVTGMYPGNAAVRVRIRFGESVGEAMSELGGERNATNDHAVRDMVVSLPWLGKLELGNTGFRFVRIDILDSDREIHLKEVNAVSVMRDIPYLGSFKSSDSLLNRIWDTGAYTVHLNMQDYLWDGIKRDRLVWVGDLHPEVATVMAVFGEQEVVRKSLDLARNTTPLPEWMNGISTYSMWWILIHRDWYRQYGDKKYLEEQKSYLLGLLEHIFTKVGPDGGEKLDGTRFLDWPSSENAPAIGTGLQAMMVWSLQAGGELATLLGEGAMAERCMAAVKKLGAKPQMAFGSKQAAALLSMAGMWTPEKAVKEVVGVGGAKNFSTFYGYYMLEAMAAAGQHREAMDIIRAYWGGMLQMGATSFWEDFNVEWMEGSTGIDEMPVAGKKDIHGDFGAYCYIGYRHSLSHGWASGPTAWLSRHVLGVEMLDPQTVRIRPQLGDLSYAEGTYPTKYGILTVKHEKQADGKVMTEYRAPEGLKVLK